MTVPHDEQPLTRRALRELERQKPRKQQKEDAKAADSAEAQRLAVAEAVARSAQPIASTPPVAVMAPSAPAAVPETAAPLEDPAHHAESAPSPVPFAPAATPVTPALSRRARRALSSDHPLADQPFAEPHVAVQPLVDHHHVAVQPLADHHVAEPLADHHVAEPLADLHVAEPQSLTAGPAPVTGPIIAEIIPDEPTPTDAIEVLETGAVGTHPVDGASATDAGSDAGTPDGDTSEVVVPVVEELIVVDGAVDPEVATQEEEEFAEIDDTVAPEAVHIITIDENPSGPILPPLVTPPAGREVSQSDQFPSAFDNIIASRGVGASNSVTSTSALVLPSVPNHGDVGTALDETGEVIITGSIDLPMSLGSTGAAPADGLESSELDAYLDPDSDVGSDVAPVSATRAVSTHGSNSGLIAPPKRSRANAPVILAVTAGVLAVGVIGLLLAALQIF